MFELANKDVLVIGLGGRGQAACELLRRQGANVTAVDLADGEELREGARRLKLLGVEVMLGVQAPLARKFNLAVLSPAVPTDSALLQSLLQTELPVISELELGFQQTQCLSIAIAGTNGKSTTTALLDRVLASNHRQTLVAGHRARPVCSVVEQTSPGFPHPARQLLPARENGVLSPSRGGPFEPRARPPGPLCPRR